MTRGLIRYQQGGGFHFVTFSCFHRLPFLGTACARELFETALERIRVRYQIAVAAYVVMPEHVHILMSEPRKGLLARSFGRRRGGETNSRKDSSFAGR